MHEEIMGGYEILGESVDDLLDGEYGDDVDILGDDFELVGDELLLGDEAEDDLLDDDLLGISQADMIGQVPTVLQRAIAKMKREGTYGRVLELGRQKKRRRQKRRRQQRQNAIATAVASRSAAVVREKPPTESREYPMGFDTVGTVAAGANVQIISRPQVTFRPERLVIGGAIAASFLVNDIKVGKNSQLTNSAALPGDAFAPTAFGVRLRMDTAQVSMDVVLDVTNISAGALRFNAALFGKAIQ